ncbi:MAG TPA: serine/threonine-protein kinase [Thermoanaerobaculia bacterium]|nr:serine/threonine-protein kinase [Thermoanaerobaculia bacterium]
MTRCPQCDTEVPGSARFCPACGQAVSGSLSHLPTEMGSAPKPVTAKPPSSVRRLVSSGSLDLGAFPPGAMLGERYRIVGLLGKGGMGEVYRADDLKLGQTVALKFLPKAVSTDESLLARFHAEVRLARQVSHPNVCRIYDIGEIEGRHFLSMEYVDGEDLASLLKRIGRLPVDKAVEIARQLCAGLHAAHEKGVLHRDLKPANVMLDGRGRVRITDFGLAVAAEEAASLGEISGTPAYMAPEQLAGKPASVRSDLYALGLVLYEIATGRRAFDAPTLAEMRRKHEQETPTAPSNVLAGFDPAVERVILRCLEKDPRARPSSAVQVAGALPGGDPLAAALAAGETPSPEMVAAAGEEGTLAAGPAWALLGGVVVLLAAVLLISGLSRDIGLAPPEKSRDSLTDRAREVAVRLGWKDTPADSATAFSRDYPFLLWMAKNGPPGWARQLATSWWTPASFRYRQSPRPLVPVDFRGFVHSDDPPMTVSGMVTVVLDTRGRLRRFHAVPGQIRNVSAPREEPPWSALFTEAGLEIRSFTPSDAAWVPPVAFDTLAGWTGTLPGKPEAVLKVVAAVHEGRPVYFELIAPWSEAAQVTTRPVSLRAKVFDVSFSLLTLAFTVAGLYFARRNLRLGRGDKAGAIRVTLVVFALILAGHLLVRHMALAPGAFDRAFWESLGDSLPAGLLVGVVYLALEPYFRRRYPELLVSWTRLISGKVRDPLVGRDHLWGVLAGLFVCLVVSVENLPPALFAAPGQTPMPVGNLTLSGLPGIAAHVFFAAADGLVRVFFIAASLFLGRLVFRKPALAAALPWLILFVAFAGRENPLFEMPGGALCATVFVVLLFRAGLLGLAVGMGVLQLLSNAPITPDLSRWFAGYGLFCLAIVLAIAVYGFWAARGGAVFSGAAADD